MVSRFFGVSTSPSARWLRLLDPRPAARAGSHRCHPQAAPPLSPAALKMRGPGSPSRCRPHFARLRLTNAYPAVNSGPGNSLVLAAPAPPMPPGSESCESLRSALNVGEHGPAVLLQPFVDEGSKYHLEAHHTLELARRFAGEDPSPVQQCLGENEHGPCLVRTRVGSGFFRDARRRRVPHSGKDTTR